MKIAKVEAIQRWSVDIIMIVVIMTTSALFLTCDWDYEFKAVNNQVDEIWEILQSIIIQIYGKISSRVC